ncbi:Cytochrome P450 monooxygenase [Pseudocercospora fuligena]|uniref:Cytochrome P450 monooxygenase n=1 Tax=Pseudocercospora fuligena TaxID=685502 RepID=A0A8H6VIA6_9PEZI|nr:Cytochrome P450 monooxygenase [Pseudocercospora fuligena]
METMYIVTSFLTIAIVGVLLKLASASKNTTLPLPPGPSGLPILGNTLQIPKEHAWRQYLSWIKEYGPVVHLSIAGKTFILLGSAAAATDLLNKKSLITSDRPRMIMANDLVTKDMHILLRPYTAMYRLHQRMQAPVLSVAVANSERYAKIYELKSLQLLHNLLQGGPVVDFRKHLETANLGVIYALVYGMNVDTGIEEVVLETIKTQREFNRVTLPGAYLVDTLPFLNYLPTFLAPWKREAERIYNQESTLYLKNLQSSLSSPGWNFAKHFSQSNESKQMSQVELAYSLGILTNAGFDTTTMVMEWFIVALINHPSCLQKAQKALDEVVGHARLPNLSDREKLPYITALVEEVLRWRNIMIAGFPHVATEDLSYQGHHIPKDSILIPHMWAIDHDPKVFSDPDSFIPERIIALCFWIREKEMYGLEYCEEYDLVDLGEGYVGV